MDRLTRHVVPSAVLVTVAIIGVTMVSNTAVAQNPNPGSAPVNVVSPLPLPVSGIVGIAPGSSLTIGNPASDPVLIRDVDNPVSQPFRHQFDHQLPDGASSITTAFFQVPAGKRLVLDDASVLVDLPGGQNGSINLRVIDDGSETVARRALTLTFQRRGAGSSIDRYEAGEPVRIHVFAGERIGLSFGRSSFEGAAQLFVNVSGYFVDVAQ
jgi:hypothetical protein